MCTVGSLWKLTWHRLAKAELRLPLVQLFPSADSEQPCSGSQGAGGSMVISSSASVIKVGKKGKAA